MIQAGRVLTRSASRWKLWYQSCLLCVHEQQDTNTTTHTNNSAYCVGDGSRIRREQGRVWERNDTQVLKPSSNTETPKRQANLPLDLTLADWIQSDGHVTVCYLLMLACFWGSCICWFGHRFRYASKTNIRKSWMKFGPRLNPQLLKSMMLDRDPTQLKHRGIMWKRDFHNNMFIYTTEWLLGSF